MGICERTGGKTEVKEEISRQETVLKRDRLQHLESTMKSKMVGQTKSMVVVSPVFDIS